VGLSAAGGQESVVRPQQTMDCLFLCHSSLILFCRPPAVYWKFYFACLCGFRVLSFKRGVLAAEDVWIMEEVEFLLHKNR
jgi:hypothetical protein